MTDIASTRRASGREAIHARATAGKTGSLVPVEINGTIVNVQCARDVTVSAGDVLQVDRTGMLWVATARLFTGAPGITDTNGASPNPNSGTSSGSLVVSPSETRTYQSGAWRSWDTSVFQGQFGGTGNRTGAVFYGGRPRALAGATVTGSAILVRRLSGGQFGAQATTMRLMTEATRPAGAPTLTSTQAGPNIAVNITTSGGFGIPTSWAQAMVDGTAGGIAFFTASASPYVQFAGLGDWAPAFSMTITWSR